MAINGTSVFCRGVVWTPPDPVSLAAPETVIRERLQLLRDGGFNLIRLAGTTVYESETFHRVCDELGIMVWQDMMFANMDYPFEDAEFRETVRSEADAELSRLSRHASTAVICGNSEIDQKARKVFASPIDPRRMILAADAKMSITQSGGAQWKEPKLDFSCWKRER